MALPKDNFLQSWKIKQRFTKTTRHLVNWEKMLIAGNISKFKVSM